MRIFQQYYHESAKCMKTRVQNLEEGEPMPDGWSKTKPNAETSAVISGAAAAPVPPKAPTPTKTPKRRRQSGKARGKAT